MSEFFTLADACNITTGKLDANAYVEGGEYPFFTCAEKPITIDTHAYDDDVILVAGNNAQGKFHLNRFKGKFNAYQRTYILTKKSGYDLDYIFYALQLELKRLKEHSQGSQTKFLTMPILTNLTFVKKDLHEQKAIASILSSLDKKIELNIKINQKLEAMAKMIYDYWFVQFDFPDANGKPYKGSGGKMVYNEKLKREIPERWKVEKLGNYAEIARGEIITNSETEQGNIKVVAAGVDYSYLHSKANREKNTITLSSSGANAGYINFWREPIFASDCITVRGKSDVETIIILHYLYLLQSYILNQAKGSAQPHVYPSDINSLYMPIPPSNLIERYEKIVIPQNDKITKNLLEIEKLTQLRDWLLPMLMNGQVKISEAVDMVEELMVAEPSEGYGVKK